MQTYNMPMDMTRSEYLTINTTTHTRAHRTNQLKNIHYLSTWFSFADKYPQEIHKRTS